MKDGDYDLGGQNVQVRAAWPGWPAGQLPAPTTNMHQEVKNLLSYGVPFRQVIKSATINPARQIHEDHQTGSLEPGKYADIVALDENMDIRLVVCRGEIAFRA
ncbi:MAG: amidohydrolase family protein [Hydrogeniiclostridium mannosilyticum]